MNYMGSKRSIAGEILPIIMEDREKYAFYTEPFVGGCNMMLKTQGCGLPRYGFDKNVFLIAMLQDLQKGYTFPAYIPKEMYADARKQYHEVKKLLIPNHSIESFEEKYSYDLALIGWVGFMASYNGRFFDGGYSGHNVKGRDYISENIANTKDMMQYLMDVKFMEIDFFGINQYPKEKGIYYCDPPYMGTKEYLFSKGFPYDIFYEKLRHMARKGNKIFVSEYFMPDDFKCVWQKEVKVTINREQTKNRIEKLYTL